MRIEWNNEPNKNQEKREILDLEVMDEETSKDTFDFCSSESEDSNYEENMISQIMSTNKEYLIKNTTTI